MTNVWHRLIEQIHAAPQQTVIVVTGGGATAIAELLSVPGGSRTLLEAVVPYSDSALADWLGRRPEHFCAEETALAMAAVAYQRACQLAPAPSDAAHLEKVDPTARPREFSGGAFIGVACTASLVSDRPKKGEHRCHIATQTETTTATRSLILEKGARDRHGEEVLVGRLVLDALVRAAGVAELPPLELRPGEIAAEQHVTADPLVVELLKGNRGVVWSLPGRSGSRQPDFTPALDASLPPPWSPPAGLLCGAFHPLHFGHRQLREAAERQLGGPVYYEMSIRNVDKPPLDFLSIERRRAQFTDEPLALTAAPTFAEKAGVLPGITFVVGVDTAERIVQPRYYGNSEAAMRMALSRIRDNGARFLVAGRKVGERFETLADIALPPDLADLFAALPADEFRADVSSTEVRLAAPH